MARQRASGKRPNEMVASTRGFRGTVRRRVALFAGGALLVTGAVWSAPGTARADAGNPILTTIHGSLQPNPDGTVTVFVRGQWNWLSHNSDCNFDRAATGVGMIWNDPTEPGFTVTKAPISAGVGIAAIRSGTAPAGENPNAYPDTYNTVDEMVHPVDRGNQAEGYTSGTFKSTTQGYSTSAAGDFPSGQRFSDPASPAPTNANLALWRGGCGRELLTSMGSKSDPFGEAMSLTCANGTTTCSGHPWGSWGYEKVTGMARGYSHTYAQRRDISQVCVNFYDVHGGGKANSSSFQVPNGTKEIDANGSGDTGETSHVNPKQPTIATTASGPVTIGQAIHDTAQLSGLVSGLAPTGTITFTAYAPNANGSADVSCGSAVFTDIEAVDSTGKATSGSFTPSGTAPQIAGTYEWIASYSGDSNYKGTTSSCNDTGEQSLVKKKDTTTPTGQKVLISDFAKPTGFGTPTGTVTFSLCDNASCPGTPIFTQTTSLVNGIAHADDPTPLNAAATYKWVVTYNGDANNSPSTSACGTEFTTLGGNVPGVDP